MDSDWPFLLVYADAERVLLTTDEIGSRPCYYTVADGLFFASELKAIFLNKEGNYMTVFAPLTTLEIWLQKYID